MPNEHMSEYLNHYTTELDNPQYTILLKEKWGSEKTHFVNKYIKQLKDNNKKNIYVSLYGVTSYDEIKTKFLQSTNKTIFNEKTLYSGKLADAFINTKIKSALGNIRRSLSSLNSKGYKMSYEEMLKILGKDYDKNEILGNKDF